MSMAECIEKMVDKCLKENACHFIMRESLVKSIQEEAELGEIYKKVFLDKVMQEETYELPFLNTNIEE